MTTLKRATLTLSLILVCAAASAQDAAVDDLKLQLAFSTWPGQAGAAKQGLKFNPADYPSLVGFSVASDTPVLTYAAFGLVRKVVLTNGVSSLSVRIGVGLDSALNGQELFLRSGPADSDLLYYLAYVRGDTSGISIGDLNFVSPGATLASLGGYIGFMRNNVFCELTDNDDNPSGVDFTALAQQLDSTISSQPSLTPAQFEASRPIVSLSPATTTLSSSAIGSTTATATDVDPTTTSGPLSRFFGSTDLNVADPGGEPATVVITASSTVGTIPLQMVAVNTFLQFGTTTVVFTVTP